MTDTEAPRRRFTPYAEALAYAGPSPYDHDGIVVEEFEIGQHDLGNLRAAMAGRQSEPGTYHRLTIDGRLWMTDTQAEIRDHGAAVSAMRREGEGDVLIHGLGLGLVVAAAIRSGRDTDVVEIDQRVIDAISPPLFDLAVEHNVDLRVWTGDALTKQWPKGQRWAVVWHDIWIDICEDNRGQMSTLHRRFGRRCDWQGSWGKPVMDAHRDRRQRSGGWW